MSHPKVFISYSYADAGHEDLVLRIGRDLRESGVDAILDKWDLGPAADAAGFAAGQMPEADRVIIVSGRAYTGAAAAAAAGDETNEPLLVSEEFYKSRGPEKFLLAAAEKDAEGRPFVPSFCRTSRVVDLSGDELYPDGFEKLLRWCWDRPLYDRPELGEKPRFDGDRDVPRINLGTAAALDKALEAVKNHRSTAAGRVDEYLALFVTNLERFKITEAPEEMDQAVYDMIVAFRPHRDEYVKLLIALAGYQPEIEYEQRLQRFFEEMLSYTNPSSHSEKPLHWGLDNFMFLLHELFLYTLAVFLKYERFEQADYLLAEKYYIPGESRYGRDEMISFDNIHRHIESLEKLNERLETGEQAPRAQMLKQRCQGSGIDFRYLVQADFTAFLRAELYYHPYYSQWYAETLTFLKSPHSPLEIYNRAKSKAYFDRMKIALGIEVPADLGPLITSYEKEKRELPRGLKPESPARLMGFKTLATLP